MRPPARDDSNSGEWPEQTYHINIQYFNIENYFQSYLTEKGCRQAQCTHGDYIRAPSVVAPNR